MSRQYNEWHFRNRSDRDWFDDAWDERQECLAALPGIHKVLYEMCNPFTPCRIKQPLHVLGFPLNTADPFLFMPNRSTHLRRAAQTAKRTSKAVQRERNDHEINRLLNACAPFPQLKNE